VFLCMYVVRLKKEKGVPMYVCCETEVPMYVCCETEKGKGCSYVCMLRDSKRKRVFLCMYVGRRVVRRVSQHDAFKLHCVAACCSVL